MGLHTWAHIYTNTSPQSELPIQRYLRLDNKKANTPPQSELPAQRCSRLDNKKANTPRSLNYRRGGVQDWTRREYKASTNGKYPPQPQLARAKLRESRGGQSLGEDVSKLGGSRDMEYPNIADGDSVAHEV